VSSPVCPKLSVTTTLIRPELVGMFGTLHI